MRVLSQSEIDALLASLLNGGANGDAKKEENNEKTEANSEKKEVVSV